MNHIKFVSYSGEYPNLCCGKLVLNIDGKDYSFGSGYAISDGESDFLPFWYSGGSVSFDNDWNANVESGRWQIDSLDLPEQFRKYANEIDDVFNDNVPYGCCGGCV